MSAARPGRRPKGRSTTAGGAPAGRELRELADQGGPVLRGPDGEPFKTFGQAIQDRKAALRIAELEARRARRERRKANAERRRADAESSRAEQAERDRDRMDREREEALAWAERLAAKLRELGLEEP